MTVNTDDEEFRFGREIVGRSSFFICDDEGMDGWEGRYDSPIEFENGRVGYEEEEDDDDDDEIVKFWFDFDWVLILE